MKPYAILLRKMPSGTAVDTQTAYGIVCKEFPFKLFGEVKELPAHTWPDEKNGADEYIPQRLYMKVEFAYKGTRDSANTAIRNFLNYLTGNDGIGGAELMVYDTYTRIGRQKVRYISADNDMFVRNDHDGDVFTFSVNFRVNDPMTDITLP